MNAQHDLSRLEGMHEGSFWIDDAGLKADQPALEQSLDCDLCIVGGGYTGLWTALKARERGTFNRVVILEKSYCGEAASGRNGGFCAPSISHGIPNALKRWPDQAKELIRLGRANFDEMREDIAAMNDDAGYELCGKLSVAATDWQVAGLRELAAVSGAYGVETRLIEKDELATWFNSPAYKAGLHEPKYALLHPGKLIKALKAACLASGVEIFEQTPVIAIERAADGVTLKTARAQVSAGHVALATNAAPPLLQRLRSAILPIFDYAIVTEPLSDAQMVEIGWTDRHGIADTGNKFHYFRKTADNRILWGGYDAVHYFGSRRTDDPAKRWQTYETLLGNFDAAFPSLKDVRFTHAWGGVIDTSARTTFFAGLAWDRRIAYAMGFTGQGVSASRFGALTMLDLLEGLETERTRLSMVRKKPFPLPPEPLRSACVWMAQRGLEQEDVTGRPSLFVRVLDKIGLGFSS